MPASAKDQLREALDNMPDDLSAAEMQELLVSYSKLLSGIDQSKRGEVTSAARVREMLQQWHASSTTPAKP